MPARGGYRAGMVWRWLFGSLCIVAACSSARRIQTPSEASASSAPNAPERTVSNAPEAGAAGEGGAGAVPAPMASGGAGAISSTNASAGRAGEPPREKLPVPPARDCGVVLNPPIADWPKLEGCRVAFEAGDVDQERSCTMMACGDERPCCNGCGEGHLVFRAAKARFYLTRARELLLCKPGRNCTAQRDCAVPPGRADVSGVLWRGERSWFLDVEELVHRVGTCARRSEETAVTSETARCEATYACKAGREVHVVCEGKAESHASQCTCQSGARAFPLAKLIRGEPPATCDRALFACLAIQGRASGR